MIKRKLFSLAAAVPFLFLGAPAIHADGIHCSYSMGFAALDGMIPNTVGGCLSNPYQISNGNTVQETVGGLLSWNPADNLPEFTDGTTTWVLGPVGLQSRANNTRFSYEAPSTNVAGVNISEDPAATVVGCVNALVSADGIDHPVSVLAVLPPDGRSC